jgi:hypothetical protein
VFFVLVEYIYTWLVAAFCLPIFFVFFVYSSGTVKNGWLLHICFFVGFFWCFVYPYGTLTVHGWLLLFCFFVCVFIIFVPVYSYGTYVHG